MALKNQELPCALCSATGGKPLPRAVSWLCVALVLDVCDEDTAKAPGVGCPGGEASSWERSGELGHEMMAREAEPLGRTSYLGWLDNNQGG